MKWEILKGSEKDFEGAPNWVTLKTHVEGAFFWLEKNEECANYLEVGMDTFYIGKISLIPPHAELIAERRPITVPDVNQQVPTEWSGDGLPPVGVECKHLPAKHCVVPHKVTILAHTKLDSRGIEVAVFQYGDVISFSDAKQFIPIRSPEDVAREKAAEAMRDSVLSSDESLTCYQAIYCAIAAGKIPGVKLEAAHD